MVKFFQNLILYIRYKIAFIRCERLNKNRNKDLCCVINLGGHPTIINRVGFLRQRYKGMFLRGVKWEQIYEKRITPEMLKL